MANIINIAAQDVWQESANPQHVVGQLAVDQYGNRYRYVKNGSSALTTGNLLQEPVEDTAFDNMATQAAVTINDTDVSVTLGGTAVTANLFDGGILHVSYGTGIGQIRRIVKHTVMATTTGTCTFTVDHPIKIALTTASSKVSVRKNPYLGVIAYPITTQTGGAVGVALYALTASYYGWIQSGGEATVLFDTGTNTSNGVTGLGPSSAVAGSVKPQTGAEGGIVIGFARDVVSTDSYQGIAHLTID